MCCGGVLHFGRVLGFAGVRQTAANQSKTKTNPTENQTQQYQTSWDFDRVLRFAGVVSCILEGCSDLLGPYSAISANSGCALRRQAMEIHIRNLPGRFRDGCSWDTGLSQPLPFPDSRACHRATLDFPKIWLFGYSQKTSNIAPLKNYLFGSNNCSFVLNNAQSSPYEKDVHHSCSARSKY